MWSYTGRKRPPFAETRCLGQESVWDYPRPPKLAVDMRRVIVRCEEIVLADTAATYRVFETAAPKHGKVEITARVQLYAGAGIQRAGCVCSSNMDRRQ